MIPVHVITTLALVMLGAGAGYVADTLGLSLPFLLGPLLAVGAVAMGVPHRLPAGYAFPNRLRFLFIAVIGLMIGAQVTPDLFADMSRLALSFAGLTVFVVLAHGFNYWVFRGLGGYDRVTAFYSATPGGLFESLTLGEESGADMPRLVLQQFLRVIVVVTALAIGLSLWRGEPVGSAGGMTLAGADVPWSALPVILLAGAAGMAAGRALRLPAWQLTGPMAAAAAISLTGVVAFEIPQWLVNVAQVVIGTALGMRFTGLGRGLVLRAAGLALVSVGGMLFLAATFAALLVPATGEAFDVLLISFAPGGMAEMALVALSLQANPALVTLHHIYRILITVLGLGLSRRWLRHRL